MDQLSTPEVTHITPLQVPPQLHTWIQYLIFPRSPLLPQNPSQRIAWKSYCKCRRQTHSVNAFPRDYWLARHLTMNLILLLMSKDYYTNMSQMLVKGSLLWPFLNLGNIQYSWKLMINWVTKVIHAHIASSNAIIIGRGWTKTLENTLQTVFFANRKKPKFSNTHYKWLKYQIDHLIKYSLW